MGHQKKCSKTKEVSTGSMSFKTTLIGASILIATSTTFSSTVFAQESNSILTEEITVVGRRLDNQLSIEAKRNAKQIIDSITASESSRLPDNNVAESLGRIPGVNFQRNIETGNGNFISIRGLDAALNNIQFDGVNAAVASGGARRVALDGITSDDIAELRVAKSLLPQDEGEGIGGSVQIVSRTPLQRKKDRANFSLELRDGEFADKNGYRARASFTKLFSENFGIDFSASFRRREIKNFSVDSSNSNIDFLPELRGPNGETLTNQDIIDIGNDDLFDTGTAFDNIPRGLIDPSSIGFENQRYEVQNSSRDTLSLSGAIDWQASENTRLTLGGRYNKQDQTATENQIQFELDERDFDDDLIDQGQLVNTYGDAEFRIRTNIEDEEELQASFFLRGDTDLGRLRLKYQASFARAEDDTPDDLSLRFDTGGRIDNNTIVGPAFSYNNGRYFPTADAGHFSEALEPTYAAVIGDFSNNFEYADVFSTPVDTEENDRVELKIDAEYDWGFEALGGTFNTFLVGAKVARSELFTQEQEFDAGNGGINTDGTLSFDSDGDLDGNVGSRTLISEFGLSGPTFQRFEPNNAPFSATGLAGVPIFNEAEVRAFNRTLANAVRSNPDILTTDISRTVEEDVFAFYLQTEFEIGNLIISGGARVERYEGDFEINATNRGELDITNLVDPTDPDSDPVTQEIDLLASANSNAGNVRTSASNTEVLPRFNALYRVSDNFQIRAGFGESIARPTISQLADETDTRLSLDIDQSDFGDTPILVGANTLADVIAAGGFTIDQLGEDSRISIDGGNPDLDNARSRNFDLSFEYYPREGTSYSVGLFYKDIDNFIFVGEESISGAVNASVLEATLSAETLELLAPLGGVQGLIDSGQLDVTTEQPENGENATVKGIEIGVNHQLDWAPGLLSNIGLNANMTFTDSDATIPVTDALEDDEALVILGFNQEGDKLTRGTPFFNAPRRSANASIFYEDDSFEVAVSGTYQDRAFDSVDDFGVDQFEAEFFQFDFYASYTLPERFGDISVYFEVPDFTDTGAKPVTAQAVGSGGNVFDNATFNGREFHLGIRGRF